MNAFPRVREQVTWICSRTGRRLSGQVMAHNPAGQNVFAVPGYAQHKPRARKATVDFDRVLVEVGDGSWHAQNLDGLEYLRVR